MTVLLERAQLTDGIPVMSAVYGARVRAAYDPQQISEAAAVAVVCRHVPQLVRNGYRILRTTP